MYVYMYIYIYIMYIYIRPHLLFLRHYLSNAIIAAILYHTILGQMLPYIIYYTMCTLRYSMSQGRRRASLCQSFAILPL